MIQQIDDMVNKTIEFIIEGKTYIGVFDQIKDTMLVVKNVMVVNMVPIQQEQSEMGFVMVPKLDLISYYTTGDTFTFNATNLCYIGVVKSNEIIKLHSNLWDQYHKQKIQMESGIEIVNSMPNNIK